MAQQQELRLLELGDFLRTRRARLTPEDVGLPCGSRRRAPGLRRAEVAQLAGMSTDWYTWLEQGRPIHVSIQVLESLVQALHLDTNERTHLFFLAHQQPPPAIATEPEAVSPVLQRYLDHLGNSPAVVIDRQWDVVAWNEAACAVFLRDFRQTTLLERNMLWQLFTSSCDRQLIVNWEQHARRVLAEFRASCGRYPADPRLKELIQGLLISSPEFRAWWPDHEVLGNPEGRKTLYYPQVGYLSFEYLSFQVFEAPDLKVTVYNPLDEEHTLIGIAQLIQEFHEGERAS
jgi:transcriptional regulator with XRE-family HTH domain